MSPRTAARLAWALWAASLAVLAGAVALETANRHAPADANELSLLLVFLCFATVGAVLASRRPGNAVGWICSAIGLTAFLGGLSESYAAYAVAHPGTLPGAGLVAWPGGTWLWYVTVALTVVFLPLLFPTGHPPSPRWRPVAWAIGLAIGLFTASVAFMPGPMDSGLGIELREPVGIDPARVGVTVLLECCATVHGARCDAKPQVNTGM